MSEREGEKMTKAERELKAAADEIIGNGDCDYLADDRVRTIDEILRASFELIDNGDCPSDRLHHAANAVRVERHQ